MRRHAGIIIAGLLALAALIGLSAASFIKFDRPRESELEPIRSSFSSGPTGTRALYQFLEESGKPVERWRENWFELQRKAGDSLLIVVGPFPYESALQQDEYDALQKWVASGGRALIVSRWPRAQFGDPVIQTDIGGEDLHRDSPADLLVDKNSDSLIVQPTELTRNIRGLELTRLASRLKFKLPESEVSQKEAKTPSPSPESPPPPPAIDAEPGDGDFGQMLYAPVIHLGDKDGAILADFNYGKGRVIFLSDPFVIANNGVSRGANLTLALNLIESLGGARRIYFDEFHHGYPIERNALVGYFRGTPAPWLLLQGGLLGLLLIYTVGRRFARPLPLPLIDRHSPLEFVGSMANLQQVAHARGLALENIFPRFKAQLCRRLGLSSRAQTAEIIESLRRQRVSISEIELRQVLSDSELALKGEQMDDAQLVKTVARMRRILAQLKKK